MSLLHRRAGPPSVVPERAGHAVPHSQPKPRSRSSSPAGSQSLVRLALMDWHHCLASPARRLRAERGPGFHQLMTLFEHIAATIGGFYFVADRMSERHFGRFAGEVCSLGTPVAEARAEAVRGEIDRKSTR